MNTAYAPRPRTVPADLAADWADYEDASAAAALEYDTQPTVDETALIDASIDVSAGRVFTTASVHHRVPSHIHPLAVRQRIQDLIDTGVVDVVRPRGSGGSKPALYRLTADELARLRGDA